MERRGMGIGEWGSGNGDRLLVIGRQQKLAMSSLALC